MDTPKPNLDPEASCECGHPLSDHWLNGECMHKLVDAGLCRCGKFREKQEATNAR